MKQKTLQKAFSFTGKGLHTGLTITANFLPAAENTGVRLCRVDLPDRPCYEAIADYVSATERGTVLEKGDWKISTVEHALSALYAMGVDNCLIEVDAPEMPILDGSAKYYVEAIQRVGLEEQAAEQKVFVVRHKMEFDNGKGSKLVILPDDEYSLDVHISFASPVLTNQFASLENWDDYAAEIASACTFCFVREVLPLLGMGLIKGGDLQNAVVIYDQEMSQADLDNLLHQLGQTGEFDATRLGYLCNLNYDNEPARHKLLDLIGDLSLIGCRIQGKVIATRPGHGVNTTFCKQLRKEMKRTEQLPPVFDLNQKPLLDTMQIKALLPHRYPMLFVDKIMWATDKTIVGVKTFTANETFFNGHFPNEPVVPAVVLLEAMAQVGGLLVLHDKKEDESYSTYFLKIDKAKFRRKVVPGDVLVMKLDVLEIMRRGIVTMQGSCYVGEQLAAEAELTAQVIKNN